MTTNNPREWLPTMGGTFHAYKAEWLDGGEWKPVPVEEGPDGVPYPDKLRGALSSVIGLLGKEQALALAWCFAAHMVARGRTVQVRALDYEVVYDLKARVAVPKDAACLT